MKKKPAVILEKEKEGVRYSPYLSEAVNVSGLLVSNPDRFDMVLFGRSLGDAKRVILSKTQKSVLILLYRNAAMYYDGKQYWMLGHGGGRVTLRRGTVSALKREKLLEVDPEEEEEGEVYVISPFGRVVAQEILGEEPEGV